METLTIKIPDEKSSIIKQILKTSINNVRGLVISDYIVFYEKGEFQLIIHTIWPTNQDSNKLNIL